MDGIHDMGGMHGLGPIEIELDEPVFHHAWEGRVFGLSSAVTPGPDWSTDGFRYMRECLPPALYLTLSYYEQWMHEMAGMCLATGVLTAEELRSGRAAPGTTPRNDASGPETVLEQAFSDRGAERAIDDPPRFVAGDAVRARNIHPTGHTRLPRYVRGRCGSIHTHHGAHVLPDSNAHGNGEAPQHLYSVRFSGVELWGPAAKPKDVIYLDLWESYLEPA